MLPCSCPEAQEGWEVAPREGQLVPGLSGGHSDSPGSGARQWCPLVGASKRKVRVISRQIRCDQGLPGPSADSPEEPRLGWAVRGAQRPRTHTCPKGCGSGVRCAPQGLAVLHTEHPSTQPLCALLTHPPSQPVYPQRPSRSLPNEQACLKHWLVPTLPSRE